MHVNCIYTDRIEIKNKKLVRIVHAFYENKKGNYKREMDILKETEDGKFYVRNVFRSVYGYGVVFSNEKIYSSTYSYYYGDDKIKTQPYSLTFGTGLKNIPFCISNCPSDEDIKNILNLYPDFKYVIQKNKFLKNEKLLETLRIWKNHKEIEILLQCNLQKIAYSKKFYELKDEKKKKIISFLKSNRNFKDLNKFSFSEIYYAVNHNLSIQELIIYCYKKAFKLTDEKIKYILKIQKQMQKMNPNYTIEQSYYSYIHYIDDIEEVSKVKPEIKNYNYWLFPNDFAKANHKIQQMKNYIYLNKQKIINEKYFSKVKNISFSENINGYNIFIPKNISDIEKQAEVLHQCLITANYTDKVIRGNCVLIFIQKNNIPIATAEIIENNKIQQFYADELDRDNCYPTDEVKDALNICLKNKPIFLKKEVA